MPVERRDGVVILARGQSSRMGRPKGLVRLNPDGPCLLRLIVDQYRNLEIPRWVVVHPDHTDLYLSELQDELDVRVITGEEGGDTARTVVQAWRSLLSDGVALSHLWAHPVDLPLVTPETFSLLQVESTRHPLEIVRPAWGEQPGHPVVLPANFLQVLDSFPGWEQRALRELLNDYILPSGGPALRVVPVPDQGVVRDFDCPSDLPPDPSTSSDRGAP